MSEPYVGLRIGAAAFAVGLSLVGPPAVASADGPDTDGSGPTMRSGAAESSAGNARPQRAGKAVRERRSTAAVPTEAGPTAEARTAPVPAAAATRNRPPKPGAAAAVGKSRRAPVPTAAVQQDSGPAVEIARVPNSAPEMPVNAAPAVQSVPAVTIDAPRASATSAGAGCAACRGAEAPTIGQAINTVINHVFNSAFDWAATLPGGPLSNLLEGVLVLVRRSLFLSPLGVTATQVGNELTVSVNTGSVAYFRQDGTTLQVSGLPSFRSAEKFDAATVSTVSVSNPGNAGCAGLVVDSGIINADLTATQIDSMRFNTGTAFAGTVTAGVTGGPLAIRNALRGLGGVTLDAAVVLHSDVEVDAGNGNARFTGTVDAARAGSQSLIVTALGDTTFDAAVGAQAALATLLTRGIVPISLQQSNDSKTIPLHYLPEYNANGQPQVKYGIDVAIGNNASQMYEFDTGGVAFFAGYNRPFWQDVPLTTTGVAEVYSSGNYYNGVISNTPITLGTGSQTVSTGGPIQIAAILAGGNANKGTVFDFTDPAVPPVEDRFFGDFGASFATLAVNGLDTPLANPLFQLPGNLSSGFLVQLGPIGIDPQLTVGVTDELRAQFPYAVPAQALVGGGTYPVSGLPVLEWFAFSPSYYAQLGDQPERPIGTNQNPQCATQCLPSLIDSGAPSTGVRLKNAIGGDPYNDNGQLQSGVNFIARFPTTEGRPPLEWTFVAGDNGSVDLVQYEQGSLIDGPSQNVNTGLNLYNDFDVMFDVKEQVIWLRPTGGSSTVSLQSVTTSGDQTYQQRASLSGTYTTGGGGFSVAGLTSLLGDTVVNAGDGDVRFSGTVDSGNDGAASLTVNSSGATEFVRGVGGNSALTSLTTDVAGSTSSSGVITKRDQTYNDNVSLNGQYRAGTADRAGSFTVTGDTTLNGPISIQASNGDITFGGAVDALPGKGFSVTLTTAPGGHITFAKDIGSTNPVGGLAVLNPNGVADNPAGFSAAGKVILDGSLGFVAAEGISIDDHVTTTLTGGGQIQSFTGDGISLGASKGSRVTDYIVSNNGGDGIVAVNAEDLRLTSDAVVNNGANGIHLVTLLSGGGAGGVEVTGSSVTGNGLNGIESDSTSDVRITNTTISGNGNAGPGAGSNGVLLNTANTVTIDGSTITGNANGGILSYDSSGVRVTNNSIFANGGVGVTVDTGVDNLIRSNSIYGNGPEFANTGYGIALQNGGNEDQPAPVVESARFVNGHIDVIGTLNLPGTVFGSYRIQVFYNPSATEFTVQGQQLLGEVVVDFVDTQFERFRASFDAPQPTAGNYVTATATAESGNRNTSRFSTPVVVSA